MKELTTEEKARRYDEAIKVAQRFYNSSVAITKKGLEDIFPELKENEDERIRTKLIEFFAGYTTDEEWWESITEKDILAWLEKQGEHAKFRDSIQIGDKVTRNQDGVLVNLSQLKRVAKPADKVEPKFKVGDRVIAIVSGMQYYITEVCDDHYYTESGCVIMFCAQDNFELVEQKPAWSEEDRQMKMKVLKYLSTRCNVFEYEEVECWLKSLKDRVLPKQEWSEQEQVRINRIVACLENLDVADYDILLKDVDWLKSLKYRYTWKPSNEQMAALDGICSYIRNKADWEISQDTISDLYKLSEQLKKLKE